MKTIFCLHLALCIAAASLTATELPHGGGSEQVIALASEVAEDLAAGGGRFVLTPRPGGGTSAYALVQRDGKTVGAVIPENSATSITGEVTTWNVGRALGCAELFPPAVRASLRGKGLATFKAMLLGDRYKGAREQNRQNILARINRQPAALPVVFKPWGSKPIEYSINASGRPNGTLNTGDKLARFLRAGTPQPTAETVTIRDGSAPRRDLARQLSSIFVVDALCGQWDRFSGGNLHMAVEEGRLHFIALDNGGADMDGGMRYLELFKGWVTRFDRPVAERLLELDGFLQGGREFLGFHSADELATAIGCETASERAAFAKRVHSVSAHVRASTARPDGVFE